MVLVTLEGTCRRSDVQISKIHFILGRKSLIWSVIADLIQSKGSHRLDGLYGDGVLDGHVCCRLVIISPFIFF